MAIDLRNVEPLGSKSVLLEQAMRRHRGANNAQGKRFTDDMDMSDMITPDFEWLKDDKTALQSLVKQMDASIGQLAGQVRDLDEQAKKSRASLEKEQQLLFKQISTLNNLLKKQVDIFSSVDRQMAQFEVKQSNMMPNIVVGLIAGLMSAVTLLASVPWLKSFI